MKQTLQLKLSQHLTLTPQLQQSIRLLQLSTIELNAEVERMLQENPLLERAESEEDRAAEVPLAGPGRVGEEIERGPRDAPAVADDSNEMRSTRDDGPEVSDFADYGSGGDNDWGGGNASDDDDFLPQQIATSTLRDHLNGQLALLNLPLRDRQIVTALIDALKVVDGNLALLANRDFTKLKRLLHTDDAGVRGVRDLIRSLNPRPGAAFAKAEANYVIPDVVVRKVRNQWVASLNEAAMPKLRLNRIYADILTRNRESSNQQLAAQLQEAKWLIRNVQQRFDTILRVAKAIVERQRRFFEHGEVAMRPMVLREIADMLSLHESTISRVTTQKYMLTPRGTFELKYFFGSHVATDTGGAASATAIRALIKQLIAAENTKTPLTDSKIADMLGEQGILVARRTIAKYREALQIPPVNMRKAL